MDVLVNSKKIKVFEHSDEKSILQNYILKRKDVTAYYYFRILDRDYEIKNGTELKTEDIRTVLSKISQENLQNEIERLKTEYSGITAREIGLLWYEAHPNEKINPENFKHIDKIAFTSHEKTKETLKKYKESIAQKFELLKTADNTPDAELDKIKSTKVSPLEIGETIVEYDIHLNNAENLFDIFNAIEVSAAVPFAFIKFKNKMFYKVFSRVIPQDSWLIIKDDIQDGIYFKILNSSKKSRKTLYGNGKWSLDNKLQLDFILNERVDEKKFASQFLKTLGKRIDYKIGFSKQKGIRCTFKVEKMTLDKYIFADLLFTNALLQNFFFLDENRKTIMNKPRIYFHYTFGDRRAERNTLGITVTQKNNYLSCRVSFSKNIQQARSAQIVFSKLLTVYSNEYDSIKNIYEQIIPASMPKSKEIISADAKTDKKTRKRLAALKREHKDLFGGQGYSTTCQMKEQPYIVSAEEAKKLRKELGENKVMEFEGSFYACEPREPDDTDQKYIYPGLKKNTASKDVVYKEKHPYVPCCFIKDQYEKEASTLNKYIRGKGGDTSSGDYIKGANKLSESGRFGIMPHNWKHLFDYMRLKTSTYKSKSIYPYLRQGVAKSPRSFLLCLQKAFGRDSENIDKVCKDISENIDDMYSVKQETYDYDNETLKEILENDVYIPPEVFVSIFENYYNCKIFLYIVNSKDPDGNILVPNNAHAYLLRPETPSDTVLIIAYELDGENFPYQCELITKVKIENNKIVGTPKAVFQGDSDIAKISRKLFNKANEVFVISPESYKKV